MTLDKDKIPRMQLTLVVVLSLIAAVSCQHKFFHCARKGGKCFNGGTCLPSGNCQCAENYTMFDCSAHKEMVNKTDCKIDCWNSGVCYNETKCLCQPEYYGQFCNKTRVTLQSCSERSMVISIIPQAEERFDGVVAFLYYPHDIRCRAALPRRPDNSYRAVLPKKTSPRNCKDAIKVTKLDDGGVSYQYRVLVRYDSNFFFPTDEIHTFTCIDSSINSTTSADVSSYNVKGKSIVAKYSSARMSILNSKMQVLNENVKIGDTLYLSVQVAEESRRAYPSLRLESCDVYPRPRNDSSDTNDKLPVIRNRCPASNASNIVMPPLIEDRSNNRILVPLGAFKFVSSSQLWFYCDVRLCTSRDRSCDAINCTDSYYSPNYGRRKRSVAKEASVVASILIEEGMWRSQTVSGNNSTQVSPTSTLNDRSRVCIKFGVIVPTVVVISLLLLLLIIILVVFVARAHQLKAKNKVAIQ